MIVLKHGKKKESIECHGEQIRKRRVRNRKLVFCVCLFVFTALSVVLVAGLFSGKKHSIYQAIVRDGYNGTQEQWLASLVGEVADVGNAKTAYELACENGYQSSEADWIRTIAGRWEGEIQQSAYEVACENGFDGSLAVWLSEIADDPETLGRGKWEKKTEYELACEYGYEGTFIEWIVSLIQDRAFK